MREICSKLTIKTPERRQSFGDLKDLKALDALGPSQTSVMELLMKTVNSC